MADGTDGGPLRRVVFLVPVPDEVLERLRARFPAVEFLRPPAEAARAALAGADLVVAWQLTAEEVAAAPRLRWFQTFGAGVDNVLIPELVARGIPITNNSGVHAPNIAEHLLALMLAFARGLPSLIRAQERRVWRDDATRGAVFELGGQTLLLVGLGDIGQALAVRAKALGLATIGVRRRRDQPVPPGVDEVVATADLPAMLPRADHVAISLPLTVKTRGLFDAALLAYCRPTAYLYNVGRGAVVDTAALVAALAEGRLAGAGLDVTDPEPLPADSPLWGMERVVITAHTSGATPRYWQRAGALLAENIARFQRGEPLRNVVDPSEGY